MSSLNFPFYPVHPGELLKEELECRHISQKSFASQLELPYSALNEILNGKRPVTTDFALLAEVSTQGSCFNYFNIKCRTYNGRFGATAAVTVCRVNSCNSWLIYKTNA